MCFWLRRDRAAGKGKHCPNGSREAETRGRVGPSQPDHSRSPHNGLLMVPLAPAAQPLQQHRVSCLRRHRCIVPDECATSAGSPTARNLCEGPGVGRETSVPSSSAINGREIEIGIEQIRARLVANEVERRELEAVLSDLLSRRPGKPAEIRQSNTVLEPDSKAYMRARRLIVNWIAARVTKAARVSARFS